ncbi:DNRLRE domain-containing protein [Nocardioides marmoraquaticus]
MLSASFRRFSPVPALAALLISSSLVAIPVSANAEPEGSAAVETDQEPEPQDRNGELAAEARSSGERVEDVESRTETTQVFVNPDGTVTTEIASGPVRAQNADGDWADIDTTLVEVEGGWAPANAASSFAIPSGGSTFADMTVEGRDMSWQWPSALPEPVIEGSTATYPDVVENGDLVVTATATGFRHDIVLREAPTKPVTFEIPIVAPQTRVKEEGDGSFTVETSTGRDLVTSAPPIMYDADVDASGEPADVAPVDAQITRTTQGGVMTLAPSQEHLTDPDTTYPVTVDPSFTDTPSGDNWVDSDAPNTGYPHMDRLHVGYMAGGKRRAFVRFNNGAGPWTGQEVLDAKLVMENFDTSSCSTGTMRVFRVTSPWQNDSLIWNNQPGATLDGMASTSVAKGASGCPAGSVEWDVTEIVDHWTSTDTSNNPTNFGFRINAASEASGGGWRSYRSANEATGKPRLIVNTLAAPSTTSYGVDEYMLEDLKRVAQSEGVSLDEAVARWGWQNEFADIVEEMSETHPESFSSAGINESGEVGGTISFTSDAPSAIQSEVDVATDDLPVDIAVETDATYTQSEELYVVTQARIAVENASGRTDVSTEYDEVANIVQATVGGGGSLSESSVEADVADQLDNTLPPIEVPGVEVTLLTGSAGVSETLRGGAKIANASGAFCTSGWPVKVFDQPEYGLVTAEHCPNDATIYSGRSGALRDASKKLPEAKGDIQYHRAGNEGVGKAFYYQVGRKRLALGVKKAVKGQFVCVFGRTSNGSREYHGEQLPTCSTIRKVNTSARGYDGLASLGSHVTKPGDSGGPWYSGGYAYGVHSGTHVRRWVTRSQFTPVYGNLLDMGLILNY